MSLTLRPRVWMPAFVVITMLGGCATPDHSAHGTQGATTAQGMSCPTHADMHQKMAAAKTPEERQAMMAEHHKGMGGSGGMACPMMQPAAK